MLQLQNSFLTVRFSPVDGGIRHFARRGATESLIAGAACRYFENGSGQWHGPTAQDAVKAFASASIVKQTGTAIVFRHASDALEVLIGYGLAPRSPLLCVHVTIRGAGVKASLPYLHTPHLHFGPGFVDSFEDDEDLYFDGAELGNGRELPCWRVFLRKGYRTGLLLATRGKREMAHFEIFADGFALKPHTFFNYSTATAGFRPPFDCSSRKVYEARFEMGPWEKSKHDRIVRAAKFNEPVQQKHPPAKGKPASRLKGKLFHASQLAPKSIVTREFHPGKWMLAKMPWAQKGMALFANAGVKPPPVLLNPRLKGLHRVIVGTGNGAGATLRISGEPETRYRMTPRVADLGRTAFDLALSGRHSASEVDFGVLRLDGKKLSIGRYPDSHQPSVIDYVRFEKLSAAEIARWEKQERATPCIPLSGHNDVPDIATITDARDPDPRAYAANIWEHANCRFDTIYWRIDGQCSDYASKVNTMRYTSAKVHGVFDPQAKAYGRVLKKVDMLKLGVEAARKYGVKLYGWMRFNSYMGNVQSDFYKNNPQFWEEWEYGRKGGKLCLAFPEVRQHKIDILTEAAGYGLDGLNLGFLRHPPVLLYAEILRKGYERKYGVPPPRNPKHPDAHYRNTPLPKDAELERWWRYRAEFLTQFGRELRAALREKNLGHVKIAIWVRANHCLFDGIDIDAWLDEGLCDEVIADFYCDYNVDLHWVKPEWKKKVQAKAKLIRGIPPNAKFARQLVPRILKEGYDGICTYESDYTVIDSDFIDLYRSLRK